MSDTNKFASSPDTQHTSALKANTVLMTRYKVMGVLGGGGMGTVYQARDLNFPDVQKYVAIKEMQSLTNDPALRAQSLKTFRREANIMATLSHPAIAKIFDFFDQDDRAYLIMEFINGSDLELLLNKTKELPIDKIIEWSIDLCDVLHYLHTYDPEPIIFRDMKPSNVMIDSLGKVRLIDFGIAKTFVQGVKQTMIGTEGYSAPEQYKGDANPVSDIYSLGATLHHVLTRRDPRMDAPFSFEDRPIAKFNAKAPQGLIDIIDKALQFNAEDRWQSCAEMQEALESLRTPQVAISGAAHAPAMNPSAPATAPDGETSTSLFEDFDAASGNVIEPKWKFETEDEIRSAPVAFNNRVFVGSYDTNIWCLDVDTGEVVWKYATYAGIAAAPVLSDNGKMLYVGSEDNVFYALDTRTGQKMWDFETKDRIRSTAFLAHNHIFFGSDDHLVYALNVGSGRKAWTYDTGGPVKSRPYVTNERVIVTSETGEIVGLELSGERKWSLRTKRPILASPIVDDEGICYVGSGDGYLYSLDATNGYSSWRFRSGSAIISSPVLAEDLVIFGSTDGYLYAINTHNGKDKWSFKTSMPIVAPATVHANNAYFGSTDGYFYCVDIPSGKERWKFQTGGPITSAVHIINRTILVGSMDKYLYALPLVG